MHDAMERSSRNAEPGRQSIVRCAIGLESADLLHVAITETMQGMGNPATMATFREHVASVVLGRSKEKVARVYARGMVTPMADAEPARNRPVVQFPADARRAEGHLRASISCLGQLPHSRSKTESCPLPTLVRGALGDFIPEPIR